MHSPSDIMLFPFLFCIFFQISKMQRKRTEDRFKVENVRYFSFGFRMLEQSSGGKQMDNVEKVYSEHKNTFSTTISLLIHFRNSILLESSSVL